MAITAAQLNVILTATGAKEVISDINAVDGSVKKATTGFDAFYASIDGGAGKALRALDGLAKLMGGLAVLGGVTLIAGGAKAAWDQVDAVEQATVALRAYEKDGKKVDKVLQDLLKYARSDMGVLFSRQELFAAAQSLKMYGAATEDLTGYVEILSRSVGLGLSDWDSLNTIIGRTGSTGRLTGDDFDSLRARGFMLDNTMRNATVTWQELFAALDKGMPADAMAGQAETIRGGMIRLRTAIRNVGLAFLGVDADTSKFIEGGLGARLKSALFDARGWINGFRDDAANIGSGIAKGVDAIESMVTAYQSIPGPIKDAIGWITKLIVAYGALRIAGAALSLATNAAGLGGLIGGLKTLVGGFGAVATGSTSLSSALGGVLLSINPLAIAMAGIIALGVSWVVSYGKQKRAVDDYKKSVSDLQVTLETLRRQGMRALADSGEGLAGIIDNLDERSESLMDTWRDSVEMYSDEWKKLQDFQEVSFDQQTQLNQKLNEALNDTNIDVDGWINWVTQLLNGAQTAEELKAAVDLILATPLSDWAKDSSGAVSDLDTSMAKVAVTADELATLFATLPTKLDDLRIQGLDQQADDLERLAKAMEKTFTTVMTQSATGDYTILDSLSSENLPMISEAWERISSALSSGDYDNARLMADILAVLGDPNLSLDQKAKEISNISTSLAGYKDISGQVIENMQKLYEITGYGDPLSQWNLSGNATAMSLLAMNAQQAATALDTTFRVVVSNTNAIASQADAVLQWADALIGAAGEQGKIDDLLNDGLITQQQYNEAQAAYNEIAQSNADIQNYVLKIQAMQAPLIAEQTSLLEDQLEQISMLPAQQQLVALGWMDSATAAKAMEFQTLAVAAATGKLGENGDKVFANMIAGAAAVDPALSAVLQDMGLISVGADGTITVHLSGVTEGMSEIDRLTVAMVNMLDLMDDGELNMSVSFDTLGLDDPRKKLEDIRDITLDVNGKPVIIPVGIDDGGDGSGDGLLGALTNLRNFLQDNVPDITIPVTVGTKGAGDIGSSLGGMAANALGSNAAIIKIVADTAQAQTDIENLHNSTTALFKESGGPTITADTSSAVQSITDVDTALTDLDGKSATVKILGDDSAARDVFNQMSAALNLIDTTWLATVDLKADDSAARSTFSEIASALYVIDTSWSATVDIKANAGPALGTIASLRLAYNGASIATSYIDIVTRTIGSASASIGGIVGRAGGGIVRENMTLVGENGPEIVQLPYGSRVFTNDDSMSMLLADRRSADIMQTEGLLSSPRSQTSGTTVVNHYHNAYTLTSEEWLRAQDGIAKGEAAYDHLDDPNAFSQYGGVT